MKGKTALIVLVAVVATAASVFVGTMAITRSVSGTRVASASTESAPGEIESTGTEVAELVADLEEAVSKDAVTSDDRDPMVKHVAAPTPPPTTSSGETAAPRPTMPRYTVTALILDDTDPMAILKLGGETITVRIGSEIKGGTVASITEDGVTLEGPAGTRTYTR